MQAKIYGDRYRIAGRKAISIRLNFLVPSMLERYGWLHSAPKFKVKEIEMYSVKNEWISLH